MKKIVSVSLMLLIAGSLHAKKIASLPELMKPQVIDIEENQLYVLDDIMVYIYSLKDANFIKKFGKKGNGPGEFNASNGLQMQVFPDSIVLNNFQKIAFFSRQGDYKSEKRFTFLAFQVIPFGDNYAVTKFTPSNDGVNKITSIIFDKDLKEVKTLYKREFLDFRKTRRAEVMPEFIIMRNSADKLFIFDQKIGYPFNVFNKSGGSLKPINMDYKRLKMTEPFKKDAMDWLKTQPQYRAAPDEIKKLIAFPDHFPFMRNFLVNKQGIYIHTYNKQKDKSEFIVLDQAGNIQKKVFLPGAELNPLQPSPYTIANGKYYYLSENLDEEEWELHVEEI